MRIEFTGSTSEGLRRPYRKVEEEIKFTVSTSEGFRRSELHASLQVLVNYGILTNIYLSKKLLDKF